MIQGLFGKTAVHFNQLYSHIKSETKVNVTSQFFDLSRCFSEEHVNAA